jgi:hypothetical protein
VDRVLTEVGVAGPDLQPAAADPGADDADQ